MVSLKQGKEGSLGACGALDSTKPKVPSHSLQVMEVSDKITHPEACPLSHCGQLRRP